MTGRWSIPSTRPTPAAPDICPGGTGWYRKHFRLTEEEASRKVRITFQGVYKHARVWINSNYLGSHAYGYTSFSFDISEFVRPGENVIAVRVEHEDVADSRWYTGSGIDRHVSLTITDPVSFDENGVYAITEKADADSATLRIIWFAEGADSVRFPCEGPGGKDRRRTRRRARRAVGMKRMNVRNPRLWSPADPYLYTLRCEAISGGEVKDTVEIPFGIRTFRFDPDQGFLPQRGEHEAEGRLRAS